MSTSPSLKTLWIWKPAPKLIIATDTLIFKFVSKQTWTGLVIKDFGAEKVLGKKSFRMSCKGVKMYILANINCTKNKKIIPEILVYMTCLFSNSESIFFLDYSSGCNTPLFKR